MIRAVAPGGVLVLTCPSAGFPYHEHPGDWWRFSVGAMGEIMAAAGLDVVELSADPESPGIMLKARKPLSWRVPASMADRWAGGVTACDGRTVGRGTGGHERP